MKERKISIKISLIVSSITTVCLTSVITPVLANVQQTFPNVSAGVVNLMSTLPALISILAMLAGGRLSARFSKKSVLLVGMILFTLGGVGTAWFENIYYMIGMRALTGVGAGLCAPTVTSIISDHFSGHERASTLGLATAFDSAVSIAFGLIAGIVGVVNWRYAFYLYAIGIFAIVMQFLFLPKAKSDVEMAKEMIKDTSEDKTSIKKIAPRIFSHALMTFILGAIGTPFLVGVSRVIMEENIGNSASSGIVMAVMGLVSFVCSLLYGKIYKGFKKYTAVIIYITSILMAVCVYFSTSMVPVMLAAVFFGAGLGMMMPFFSTRAAEMAPISSRTLVIGIVIGCLSVGQFVGGFTLSIIESIFKVNNIRSQFGIIAIIFVIATILVLIYTIRLKEPAKSNDDITKPVTE